MTILHLPQAGQYGIIKDLSQHEMPPNAWTDGNNVQFIDGYVKQCLGYSAPGVYGSPTIIPKHVTTHRYDSIAAPAQYLITAGGSNKIYAHDMTIEHDVTPTSGFTIGSHVISCSFGTYCVLTGGGGPFSWNGSFSSDFVALSSWPTGYTCASIRNYNQFLIAMYIGDGTTSYPFRVKWSHPADPGTLPSSWDQTDATKDAGHYDLMTGGDVVVDGQQMRDSFIVYKDGSCWRMDYTGGPYVFKFSPISKTAGARNVNCIGDIDGAHIVFTDSDIILNDGQNVASILDNQSRKNIFSSISPNQRGRCFVFVNTIHKLVYCCYPTTVNLYADKAYVWDYKNRTGSFVDIPNLWHGNNAANLLNNGTSFPWSTYNVLLASNNQKIHIQDYGTNFNGTAITSYIERIGLSFGQPDKRKYIKRIMPRIKGTAGQTMTIKVGSSFDPYTVPTNYQSQTFTIGSTESCHYTVDGRYIGIKIENGTATDWRLDSMSIDYELAGDY